MSVLSYSLLENLTLRLVLVRYADDNDDVVSLQITKDGFQAFSRAGLPTLFDLNSTHS